MRTKATKATNASQSGTGPGRRPVVLVVEDDELMQSFLEQALTRMDLTVVVETSAEAAITRAASLTFDLALLDVRLGGMDGISLLGELRGCRPACQYVVMTAHGSLETAIAAMRAGAFDFLTKPFTVETLEVVVERALGVQALKRENERLRARVDAPGEPLLIGRSAPMRWLRDLTRTVARSPATVLVEGESGTGKELVAQALHAWGPRAYQPLVKVNCAALPSGLMESELFGHERGAFTGASQMLRGKFELANRGTLVLDEIGEMDLVLQPKLLRAIQEKEFYRVGGTEPVQVDLRIVATTNANLAERARAGRFRQDLYYRLRVIPIRIAPLRERREDIPRLAAHFLELAAAENKKRLTGFAPEALSRLMDHPWPGNVRELENVVHRAAVLTEGPVIGPELLQWDESLTPWAAGAVPIRSATLSSAPEPDRAPAAMAPTGADVSSEPLLPPGWDRLNLREVERRCIEGALKLEGGNKSRAARRLGISVRTIRNKLHSYQRQSPVATGGDRIAGVEQRMAA